MVTKNKIDKGIECKSCGYKWFTKSDKLYITCPNCLKKVFSKEEKGEGDK